MSDDTVIQADRESLVEVWKVLENVTVSLDRLGTYRRIHGEAAAQDAILEYFDPSLFQQITQARGLLVTILEKHDPGMLDQLEQLSTNEAAIGYWDGRK